MKKESSRRRQYICMYIVLWIYDEFARYPCRCFDFVKWRKKTIRSNDIAATCYWNDGNVCARFLLAFSVLLGRFRASPFTQLNIVNQTLFVRPTCSRMAGFVSVIAEYDALSPVNKLFLYRSTTMEMKKFINISMYMRPRCHRVLVQSRSSRFLPIPQCRLSPFSLLCHFSLHLTIVVVLFVSLKG